MHHHSCIKNNTGSVFDDLHHTVNADVLQIQ